MAQTIREKARIRQNRDDGRLTEDDIARGDLGPRDEKGKSDTANKSDTAKMTRDSEVQTPSPLDPGTRPESGAPTNLCGNQLRLSYLSWRRKCGRNCYAPCAT